jgi:hypothetical protein
MGNTLNDSHIKFGTMIGSQTLNEFHKKPYNINFSM